MAGRQVLGLFAAALGLGVVLAVIAGWVWVSVADPPTVPLAENGGLFLGEQELDQLAGVTLWFFAIGAAFGALAGVLIGWFGQRFGWLAVVAVLVACAVGSLLSRYLGIHVFGPDQGEAAAHAALGDPVQLSAQVETWVAHLGWPIGGVIGALAAIAAWSHREISPNPTPSPTLPVPFAENEH
jgi:hypothetical protein